MSPRRRIRVAGPISFVVDTMALILWLENRKLPAIITDIFQKAEREECIIYIPTMVFAEIGYLSEKGRIDITLGNIENYFVRRKNFKSFDISFKTIKITFEINDIPELHDRMIAAVAVELDVDLITNDPKIRASSFVDTIWD